MRFNLTIFPFQDGEAICRLRGRLMKSYFKTFFKIFILTLLLNPIPRCGFGFMFSAAPPCNITLGRGFHYFIALFLLLSALVKLEFTGFSEIILVLESQYIDLSIITLISVICTIGFLILQDKEIFLLKKVTNTRLKNLLLFVGIWIPTVIIFSVIISRLKLLGILPLDYIG